MIYRVHTDKGYTWVYWHKDYNTHIERKKIAEAIAKEFGYKKVTIRKKYKGDNNA
jgi:hypothetical protein